MLIGSNKRQDKVRLDNIVHDIAVLDTAIYVNGNLGIPLKNIVAEKQLHSRDGFSNRKHQPDFVFKKGGKTYCVEVELSLKSRERLEKNLKSNFSAYDTQIWFIENLDTKLFYILNENKLQYPNIKIVDIEKVREYVREHS